MNNVVSAANTTATVLGYLVLTLLVGGVGWFLSVRHDAWKYKRRRQRQHDIDWDNLRSAWIFDMHQDRVETKEQHTIARVDTDVLNYTVEQIYDYQKEYGK